MILPVRIMKRGQFLLLFSVTHVQCQLVELNRVISGTLTWDIWMWYLDFHLFPLQVDHKK